jgi:hypothetical protein
MQPNITIDHDKVSVEGVLVARPTRIAPMQWLEWWEGLMGQEEIFTAGYNEGLAEGKAVGQEEAYLRGYNAARQEALNGSVSL